MPGCAADYCTNSSTKGYKMVYFPRDPHRRAMWTANMNRLDWMPTNTSTICEVHFTDNMWGNVKANNKRKLKSNAVPTLFGKEVGQANGTKRRIPRETGTSRADEQVVHMVYSTENHCTPEEVSDNQIQNPSRTNTNSACVVKKLISKDQSTSLVELEKQNQYLKKLWMQSERLRKVTKIKLQMARKKIKRLEEKARNNGDLKIIHPILEDD